jgi:hypothetical protein
MNSHKVVNNMVQEMVANNTFVKMFLKDVSQKQMGVGKATNRQWN